MVGYGLLRLEKTFRSNEGDNVEEYYSGNACKEASSRFGIKVRTALPRLAWSSGRRASESKSRRVCARVLLASARRLLPSGAAKVEEGVLGRKARGEQGKRRKRNQLLDRVGLESDGCLGVRLRS